MSDEAEDAFNEGKRFNLKGTAGYNPFFARHHFEIAAKKSHVEAVRSLALMLHQGAGGDKDLSEAVRLLSKGYFHLGDSEALECLENLLREEVEAGQTVLNDIDLAVLADRVESLKKYSDRVRHDVGYLIRPSQE